MSAFALISGRLHGEPTTRPTRTGGQVTFFTVRVANGSAIEFWSVATFSEAIREDLAELPEGYAVSCSGALHVELEEWNGAPRMRRRMTADCLLALTAKPKPKAPSGTGRGRKNGERVVSASPDRACA